MDRLPKCRFFQFSSCRNNLLNPYNETDQRGWQRIFLVQEQQVFYQEAISQRADQTCADAVKTRLGLPHSPPVTYIQPHPPVQKKTLQVSHKSTQTKSKMDPSPGSSFSSSSKFLSPISRRCENYKVDCDSGFRFNSSGNTGSPQPRLSSSVSKVLSPISGQCESKNKNSSRDTASVWSSLSSVDTHIPSELRDVFPISPEPSVLWTTPPQPPSMPKVSQLPMLKEKIKTQSKQISVADVKDGPCTVQPGLLLARNPWGQMQETALQFGQGNKEKYKTKRVPEIAPFEVHKLSAAMPVKTTAKHPTKTKKNTSKQESTKKLNIMEYNHEYKPLHNPAQSLTKVLSYLEAEDWKNKVDACQTIKSLAQHHKETLLPKLHYITLALSDEVKSIRYSVFQAVTCAITDLFIYLRASMNSEVELMCKALLLRLARGKESFILEPISRALEALVQNCTDNKLVITALLKAGMDHRCSAVRATTAKYVTQAVHQMDAETILFSKKSFLQCFLDSVAKMATDASPDVRYFGIEILKDISSHRNFHSLWQIYVPEKKHYILDKILKKLKQFC